MADNTVVVLKLRNESGKLTEFNPVCLHVSRVTVPIPNEAVWNGVLHTNSFQCFIPAYSFPTGRTPTPAVSSVHVHNGLFR